MKIEQQLIEVGFWICTQVIMAVSPASVGLRTGNTSSRAAKTISFPSGVLLNPTSWLDVKDISRG